MKKSNFKRFNEILKILKESEIINGLTPKKLCTTIERLGPTFIKLGQILSTRVELLPKEYIDELAKLRANNTPLSTENIKQILIENYHNLDDLFKLVEEKPIATASIAQVHKATLSSGEKVILKIKKPNIEDKMLQDISLFRKAINVLHLNSFFKIINLNEALNQFEKTTKEELDFQTELNHLEEFRNNHQSDEIIYAPKPYKELSTKNILVMEYIEGYKINDLKSLQVNDYNPVAIANVLCLNYIKQALEDGFFHADPHPDNILIKDDNIVYIDLGMMGRLNEKNKTLLKNCIDKIILEDYNEVTRILVNMSRKLDDINFQELQMEVTSILLEFQAKDLKNISALKFFSKMIKVLNDNHLELDEDVTLLIRGICVIESIIELLSPNTNLLNILIMSKQNNYSIDINSLKTISKKVIRNVDNMLNLPSELTELVKSLNNEEKKFKVELDEATSTKDKIEKLVHELIIGFIMGCLIIAIVLVKDIFIRNIFLVILLILTIILIIKMITDIIKKG